MLDLILRDARPPRTAAAVDIAVAGGRIVEVAPRIEAEAHEVLDARGCLVTPPFVDSHFHMDATLSLGRPRYNESARGACAAGPSRAASWPSAVTSTSPMTGSSPWTRCWPCARR